MKHIDLAFIRTYLAVAETGSLTLAAKMVGKTISTLSYQISQLESVLGQKLFTRGNRGMMLSDEGEQFLLEARFFLETHEQISKRTKSALPSLPDTAALKRIISARKSVAKAPARKIDDFRSNLETGLLRNIFSSWQSRRADGQVLSLDDLIKSNIISSTKHNFLLMDTEETEFRCVWASDIPAHLFQLDRHGFGMTFDQAWKSPKISESRKKIFSICKSTDVPVFFSGNAPIPWHSTSYANTIDRFVSTRLDRLLVPVKIKTKKGNHSGILQIAEFRDRVSLPLPRNDNLSEEEHAASLNFIGNISVAL